MTINSYMTETLATNRFIFVVWHILQRISRLPLSHGSRKQFLNDFTLLMESSHLVLKMKFLAIDIIYDS